MPKPNKTEKAGTGVFVFGVVIFFLCIIGIFAINAVEESEKVARREKLDASSDQSFGDVLGQTNCTPFTDLRDSLFKSVTASRKWVLLGEELEPEQQGFNLNVDIDPRFAQLEETVPQDQSKLYYTFTGSSDYNSFNNFLVTESNSIQTQFIDMSSHSPGEYEIRAVLETNCGTVISPPVKVVLSYPLYVVWTLDWEGFNVPLSYTNTIDSLSKKHGNIPITHFFNPRLFVTSAVKPEDVTRMTEFVKYRKVKFGDEIGLHTHMFPDMVEAAGVTPQKTPNWGWNREDGYDILVSGYSYDDTVKILEWSKLKFAEHNLGTPISYRAGGWFADRETLMALEDTGFKVDSSGRNRFAIAKGGAFVPWDLTATTMPYRPSYKDQNVTSGFESDLMKIWEFPNNGGDSTALTADEMHDRLKQNYNGNPLYERKVVNYLTHPDYLNIDKPRIEALLNSLDAYMYKNDSGPLLYATLEDLYMIWENADATNSPN